MIPGALKQWKNTPIPGISHITLVLYSNILGNNSFLKNEFDRIIQIRNMNVTRCKA
jgi:hypothetical protein